MKYSFYFVLLFCFFKSFSQEKDLNYFLQRAEKNAPLLTDIKNQISANTLDSLVNRASNKPQIAGNLSANYAPVFNDIGYDNAVTNGQVVSGLVGVNKKIIGRKIINSQADTYKLIKEALVLNKKIVLKDLNKIITAQYITASGSLEQIEYQSKIESLLKEETTILKKLTQSSVYKQTDYLLFSATVMQQEFTLLQQKQQYQNDLSLLNYLSGEVDTTNVFLKKPVIALEIFQKNEKSIFLKQFEIDSLKFQNQNKLIDFSYKPKLSLLADAGYLSSFAITPYKNFGFSVGLGLSIPIYDGGQRELLHQKNNLNGETALGYKANFKRQFEQQLLLLQQKLNQYSVLEKQLKSQLVITDALVDSYRKLLLTGDVQITDYVIAIGNLITINTTISQNTINKLQTINEINYWSKN